MSWGLNISYSLDQFGILNESKKLQEKSLRMMHDSWNCCAMRASSVEPESCACWLYILAGLDILG